MASNEKVRIKIKGYEHSVVDAAAAKIVEAVKRSGAQVSGPIPLPTDKEVIIFLPCSTLKQTISIFTIPIIVKLANNAQ